MNADSIITKEHCFDEDLLDARWYKMEEDLITEARGIPPLIFKPTFAFYGTNDTIKQFLYENGISFIPNLSISRFNILFFII